MVAPLKGGRRRLKEEKGGRNGSGKVFGMDLDGGLGGCLLEFGEEQDRIWS